MATSTYGVLQEFQPGSEPIAAYIERVQNYFAANDIASDKRVPVLLSVIGSKTYALLRSLTAPDMPSTKSLEALIDALMKHYEPKPLLIVERFHFN